MTSEQERRLLVLAASERLAASATKDAVLGHIEAHDWIELSAHDVELRRTRNELVWRSDLSFVRDHLRRENKLSDAWNKWEITSRGRQELLSLATLASRSQSFSHIRKDSIAAILAMAAQDAISDESALSGETVRMEGSTTERWVTTYERDKTLRAAAIAHFGTVCMGCGFDFAARYGTLGLGFIEVHHLKPVSSLAGPIQVKVATDLVVLCSNCHSIVHRQRGRPVALQELRQLVNANR